MFIQRCSWLLYPSVVNYITSVNAAEILAFPLTPVKFDLLCQLEKIFVRSKRSK